MISPSMGTNRSHSVRSLSCYEVAYWSPAHTHEHVHAFPSWQNVRFVMIRVAEN